jgi:hypothetical protein
MFDLDIKTYGMSKFDIMTKYKFRMLLAILGIVYALGSGRS